MLAGWPISSLWLLGTLVGVELIFRGSAWLGVGAAIRRALRRGRDLRETHDDHLRPGGLAAG